MAPGDTLYVCKITFLKVTDVPVADFHDLSCDPYLQATLSADTDENDGVPQTLTYRTQTCRRTLNPEFNAAWIVSGIPASGFLLSIKLRDEDPGNYDDDLGKAVLRMPNADEGKLEEGWKSGDREYKVHKRRGSVMSKVFTCTANVLTRGDIGHRVRIWVRAEVIAKAGDQKDRRLYTVGPRKYVRHFSPLIGKFLGSSNSPDGGDRGGEKSKVQPSAFVANRIQLAGPVPSTLRHRYVGFAPFVKAMFRRSGIRGLILHHALHKQHLSIYKWDKNVVWGVIGDNDDAPQGDQEKQERANEGAQGGDGEVEKRDDLGDDSLAMAKQFLKMTSYGTHGRIFTYVIMLDGEWRFTETGDQMAIEFLSKHTMHSDVAVEIAYSGEFFVRPLRHRRTATKDKAPTEPEPAHNVPPHTADEQHHDTNQDGNQPKGGRAKQDHGESGDHGDGGNNTAQDEDEEEDFDEDNPPTDPARYELVIDNDSGTYRPRADLLPTLHAYLASPPNLGALGRVTAMNGFDERLKRWKDARKKAKAGDGVQLRSVSSVSSGSSASSGSSSVSGAEGVNEGDMRKVVEEDAKRARDNADADPRAKEEEKRADEGGDAQGSGR